MTCCNAYSIHINHELMLKRVPNSAVKTITMTLGSTFVFLSILLLFCVKLSSVNANSYREFLRMGQSVKIQTRLFHTVETMNWDFSPETERTPPSTMWVYGLKRYQRTRLFGLPTEITHFKHPRRYLPFILMVTL